MEGKRVADPNCLFIAASTTSPDPSSASEVALIYNSDPGVSSQINPAFDVVVYGPLPDVYGVAFHLSYDSNILAHVGTASAAAVGNPAIDVIDFKGLGADGVSTSLRTSTQVADKIIFGLTRLDPTADPLSLADGPNIVARLFFTAVEEGTFEFSFNKLFLVDSNGADVAGVQGLPGSTITTRQECL
jgi:hypothetical protein